MYHFLYNFFLNLFASFIKRVPFEKAKRKQWQTAQKEIYSQYQNVKKGSILFIIASSGEFEQAKPLIEQIREFQSDIIISVSFFSPSGFNQLNEHPLIDQAFYTPLDTRKNIDLFVNEIQPKAVIFVKYELWLNLMKKLGKLKIPRILISAIFDNEHFITKWYGKLHREELRKFEQIFVQDDKSKYILQSLGISSHVAGDTRIDRSVKLPSTKFDDEILDSLNNNSTKLILGSAWQEDIDLFAEIKEWIAEQQIQLLIAPHELNEPFLQYIQSEFSAKRYSKQPVSSNSHLLIDKIGILKYAYRYAHIAYVGGGFGNGIHNTLEPAAYGIPVIFGPKHNKFVEAKQLIEKGGGYSIKNKDELKAILINLLEKNRRKEAGEHAKTILTQYAGATEIIYKQIRPLLQ